MRSSEMDCKGLNCATYNLENEVIIKAELRTEELRETLINIGTRQLL
jgi:hypothetical protein